MDFFRKHRAPIAYIAPLVFVALVGVISMASVHAQDAGSSVQSQPQTLPQTQPPPIFVFLRNLREGDSGADVRELQKILNLDPETQVSDFGAGSPGNETDFFGPATTAGVIRFQTKYAAEVLRPSGLAQGSGFVGLWTRLMLNQILLKSPAGDVAPAESSATAEPKLPTDVGNPANQPAILPQNAVSSGNSGVPVISGLDQFAALAGSDSKELRLDFISSSSGPAGSSLTLSGAGFSLKSNTVSFDAQKSFDIKNVAAQNPNQLTVVVPANTKPGRYEISVSNSGSRSAAEIIPVPFMVTVPGAVAPVIEKIEPLEAVFGEPIKITGRNFTSTGNIVSTGVGIIDDVKSPDGKTLTVTLERPEFLQNDVPQLRKIWFGDKDNLHWPIRVRIVNVNGVSDSSEASKILINL